MSQSNLTHMADILPLLPEADPTLNPLIFAFIGLVLVVTMVGYISRFHSPLGRLAKQLNEDSISSRTAAHRLAAKAHLNPKQQQNLNQLRFSATEPDKQAVLLLIRHSRQNQTLARSKVQTDVL